MQTVTVFGANGIAGTAIVLKLARDGFKVKAVVRDKRKALQKFQHNNIFVVEGDLKDPTTIESALEKSHVAIISLSINPNSNESEFQPERDGLAKVIQVASQLGVSRICYLSNTFVHFTNQHETYWWPWQIKKHAMNAIIESGIPYSIYHCSFLMEYLTKGNYRKGGLYLNLGKNENPYYFIASEDMASQVSNDLKLKGKSNREYVLQGAERHTIGNALDIIRQNTVRNTVTILNIPSWMGSLLARFNKNLAYKFVESKLLSTFKEPFEAEKTWQELGKPIITLDRYARADH